eukprot:GHVN01065480.1.p1 GENE.GHVN01065480.1~~GHVN01065480.1.p1  ORF type:complete len:577 (-),score=150.91 GHVN01065480.1:228-1958(-)
MAGGKARKGLSKPHSSEPPCNSPTKKRRTVPTSPASVQRIDINTITPESFFNDYISKRIPVVVTQVLDQGSEFSSMSRWASQSYLSEVSGSATVKAERSVEMDNPTHSYGHGERSDMSFDTFLKEVMGGCLYMTTYPVRHTLRSLVALAGPPVIHLTNDFPHRPAIAGSLVPFLYSLWIGHCSPPAWSCTGLHHDYHDNFYVIVSGRKEFRLFSPTTSLPTVGERVKTYENGRICYDHNTREDGANTLNVLQWKIDQSHSRLTSLKHRAIGLTSSDPSLKNIKQQIKAEEANLDKMLDVQLDSPEAFSEEDDFLDDEQADPSNISNTTDFSSSGNLTNPPHFCTVSTRGENKEKETDKINKSTNNSKLNSLLNEYLSVVIEPGDLLYLPAGWFHEVLSQSQQESESWNKQEKGPAPHIAFNYWFHPPVSLGTFTSPYEDNYWSSVTSPLLSQLTSLQSYKVNKGQHMVSEVSEVSEASRVSPHMDLNRAQKSLTLPLISSRSSLSTETSLFSPNSLTSPNSPTSPNSLTSPNSFKSLEDELHRQQRLERAWAAHHQYRWRSLWKRYGVDRVEAYGV